MTAVHGLVGVIVAFAAILGAVLAMALRERRLAQRVAADDRDAASASDVRVLTVIFVAIPAGMLLTVLSAWLVFF